MSTEKFVQRRFIVQVGGPDGEILDLYTKPKEPYDGVASILVDTPERKSDYEKKCQTVFIQQVPTDDLDEYEDDIAFYEEELLSWVNLTREEQLNNEKPSFLSFSYLKKDYAKYEAKEAELFDDLMKAKKDCLEKLKAEWDERQKKYIRKPGCNYVVPI